MLAATDTAQFVHVTDAEQGTLKSWMMAVVAANHILYSTCPPALGQYQHFWHLYVPPNTQAIAQCWSWLGFTRGRGKGINHSTSTSTSKTLTL
jgi:hypothetical protein